MHKDKVLFRARKFLNKLGKEEGAFILSEIQRTTYQARKDKKTGKLPLPSVSVYCTFKVADCDRQINLSFNMENKKSFVNSLYKLAILEATIKQFKEVFQKEYTELTRLAKEGKIRKERF